MDAEKLSRVLRGRVVSGLDAHPDRLELSFADGSRLAIEPTSRGVSVILHEYAGSGAGNAKDRPTRRQHEYLDFIRRYMARHGVAPAESDIQEHFMVSAPAAHEMVKTLERRGFIDRRRDLFGTVVPRSIRVLID